MLCATRLQLNMVYIYIHYTLGGAWSGPKYILLYILYITVVEQHHE
jgi:hypothetical protein